MLRFAKTRLRGRALRWYSRLDQAIKKDWDLFVQALFDQYPLVEAPDDGAIATPIWSATTFSPNLSTITLPANPELNPNPTTRSLPFESAIPRPYDASSEGQQIGVLRIVTEEGTRLPQYVWWGYTAEEINRHGLYSYYQHPKSTTTNRHEALIVSFIPSSAPHQIGCLNTRAELRTLTILYDYDPSVEVFTLYGCNQRTTIVSPAARNNGFASKAWNILADGTLQASISCRWCFSINPLEWTIELTSFAITSNPDPAFSNNVNNQGQYEETKLTTAEVHVDTSGTIIRFVKPGVLLEQNKPQGDPPHPFVRARIVFEPL
ncbi:hypothetical protein M407DRAFT_27964 [Tulasnella calospora MUT 4182]|uniref:Uncharacterized protein n=1 Tax=Tulasnella calospora MUT 4182 TaxID=1051891 RepID=A0A0C3LMI9_9AGAM|nr:hypothetical protein M407DRAFT_27964 [Tulasnella calospora MUT 4182]